MRQSHAMRTACPSVVYDIRTRAAAVAESGRGGKMHAACFVPRQKLGLVLSYSLEDEGGMGGHAL
jgi:hypothetical protein